MIVVMGAAEHLEETLVSLLRQTLQDFEIIIVSGGLHESAQRMLDRCSANDTRIKVFEQQMPGIAAARTQALQLASGKYCAVNDADDISLPHRLEKQVNYLEAHPEVSMCGGWIRTFGAGTPQIRYLPPDDAMIRSQMMFICPFAHSTVMWRRDDILQTGQIYMLESSEDYDLWARLVRYIRFANLPDVLVNYRLHEDQRSNYVEKTDLNWKRQIAIRTSLVEMLDIVPSMDEADLHQKISAGWTKEVSMDDVEAWLLKLRENNRAAAVFPPSAFEQAVADRWWDTCLRAKTNSNRIRRFFLSPITAEKYSGISSKTWLLLRFIKHWLADGIKKVS